jgi:hypothetical protein
MGEEEEEEVMCLFETFSTAFPFLFLTHARVLVRNVREYARSGPNRASIESVCTWDG